MVAPSTPQTHTPRPSSPAGPDKLLGIRHIVAIASGKGGVGKSTVSVNLALALHALGARVGLVDADVLGPSIPVMLGIPAGQAPAVSPEGRAIPMQRFGIKTMSMGMLTTDDAPAVLRGPMVGKYLQMLISGAEWGPLDYLVLDLPPGTGDTQLSLAQNFPLSGGIIVTTPQSVSLKIARRGLRMFERVQVPILGIIENMSGFTCPHCGKTTDVFHRGGGAQMSRDVGVPYLGAIPLDPDVVAGGDNGRPIVIDRPDSNAAKVYADIAIQLADRLHGTPAAVLKPFRWTWSDNQGAPVWMEGLVSPSGARTTPIGLRRLNARTLSLLWADGRRDEFDVRDLRLACHCALCIEEMSGRKLLDPGRIGLDVSPRVITSIGNYAIGVDWSDGHNSGIYSFDYLRTLGEHNANAAVEHV